MNPDLQKRYSEQIAGMARGNTGKTGGISRPISGKVAPETKEKTKSKLPGIVQKGVDVGKQIGGFAGTAAKKTGSFAANVARDVVGDFKRASSDAAAIVGGQTILAEQNRILESVDKRQQQATKDYYSGKMSREDYQRFLKGTREVRSQLAEQTEKFTKPTSSYLSDFGWTAVDVLSTGRAGLFKPAAKAGVKTAAGSTLVKGAKKLQDLLVHVPAAKDLVMRSAAATAKRQGQELIGESAAKYISREGKRVAAGLLIKRPIFYEANIGGAQEVFNDIMSGDYDNAVKTSAWLGTQMLSGGPIGAAAKGFGWLKNKTGKLAYGKGSFIDELSRGIGNGNPNQITRFLTTLKEKAPNEYEEANKTFRILQETNLRSSGEDAVTAAENVLQHYTQHGYDVINITPSQLYKDMRNWAQADELAQQTLRSGLVHGVSPEDAGKYSVVRWDGTAKEGLANAVRSAGNHQEMIDAVYKLADRPGVGWGNNPILMKRIEQAIVQSKTPEEAAEAIRGISAASAMLEGLPKKISERLAKFGYTVAAPFGGRVTPVVGIEDTRKLVTAGIKGDSEIFDIASSPQPQFQGAARVLERAGLSPRSANEVVNRKLAETLVATLDESGVGRTLGFKNNQGGDIVNGGRVILSQLQRYIETKRPALGLGRASAITDIRMLRSDEIAEALHISKSEAKDVSKAIVDAYTKIPLEYRGLGDKIVDTLYKVNPLQKHYARIQSALRYTYNPFFRTQERVETALLSRMQAKNIIWNKSRAELTEGARVLDEAGIFTSSFSGEGAQDVVLGRITANLTAGQKRDLAGLGYNIAEAKGMTLQRLAIESPDELEDALRVVVQYPNKGILASNLARTMNLAFFPMRYNAKVTMLAGQLLAKQPPAIQLAVVNSMFRMRDWLKSDEGIEWQSEHADAIQVLSWLTPINSVEYSVNLLTHRPDAVGELGLLGGLPLGVITQILDSQGVINLNRPYVQPTTGDVMPKYIPEATKARAAIAVGDLIGSMFTYPGRILGLPGKEATIRDIVRTFIDTNGTDFDKRLQEDRLTPLQKDWVRVLKGDMSEEAIDALYKSPAPGMFNYYTLPPLDLPIAPPTTPVKIPLKRTGLPSSKTSSKPKVKKLPQPISNPLQ